MGASSETKKVNLIYHVDYGSIESMSIEIKTITTKLTISKNMPFVEFGEKRDEALLPFLEDGFEITSSQPMNYQTNIYGDNAMKVAIVDTLIKRL